MSDMRQELYEVKPKAITTARVRPPGSKSITNRALIVAALANGVSRLDQPLNSSDTEAMSDCLRRMGVRIDEIGGSLVVGSRGVLDQGGHLDARASGTTARFITAAATLADGPSVVDGVERMRERPIGDLVDALRALGARVATENGSGFPPVLVAGGGLGGGRATIDASSSSQFVSAVLLVAPLADATVTLDLEGDIVSRPYLDTTLEVMDAFGGTARWLDDTTIEVDPNGYAARKHEVEADASAAVYPWSAAAITGGTVTVTGIAPDSSQADVGALDILQSMGCDVTRSSDGLTVSGPDVLNGVSVDMNHCPDAVLSLAVVAAFADSETHISNVANLRIKETDRLAALETELAKLGAHASTGPDWIHITPGQTRPARIATYDDHRMAMAFAVGGLRQTGVVIEDPGCVAKTWPNFFEMLEAL